MFCDRCGMQLLAVQSTCGCGATATRHWLQFVAVLTLLLAGGANVFITRNVLPGFLMNAQPSFIIRAWVWFSNLISVHGWILLALGLLVWAFWPRHGYTPEMPVRVGQGLLILALLLGLANFIFPFITMAWAAGINTTLADNPGLVPTLTWVLVVLALGGICYNAETRDLLFGTGKILSLVALGVLALVVMLMIYSWMSLDTSAAHHVDANPLTQAPATPAEPSTDQPATTPPPTETKPPAQTPAQTPPPPTAEQGAAGQ